MFRFTVYSEDDEHQPIDFIKEELCFTCQLFKIKKLNLKMTIAKTGTDCLLLSITKKFETLDKQSHTKPRETLEFKLNKARETFSFKPPKPIDGSWTLGLPNLEVYDSIFNITEKSNNFELYTGNFDGFSFEELKDELGEIFIVSAITPSHLQHETIGPRNIEAYDNFRLENSSTDGYKMLLMGYSRSPFRGFETYLRIVVGLDKDDSQFILKQCN